MIRDILHVLDFFIPMDVLLALFVVFSMEHYVEYYVTLLVPVGLLPEVWLLIALISVVVFGTVRYYTASDEEIEELEEELEEP